MSNIITSEIISLDIRNYSKLSSSNQLVILKDFTSLTLQHVRSKQLKNKYTFIPNGDGFHVLSTEAYSIILALILKKIEILLMKKYPFFSGCRISIIIGDSFSFKDIVGNTNYMGRGILEAEEITSAKELFYLDNIVIESSILQSIHKKMGIKFTKPFLYQSAYREIELIHIWLK